VPYLTSGDKGVSEKFGGVSGFLKSLQWLLRNSAPKRCIVVWDSGLSSRRLSLYPNYKGRENKKPLDEEADLYLQNFALQRSYLNRLLPLLRVNVIELPCAEGDDLIYECVKVGRSSGFGKCVIVSEDKDFMQLIDPDVSLYRPVKRDYVNASNFLDVAGVSKESFLLYRAICGDASDKIYGVKGVGDKTAKKALEESGSLDPSSLCLWASEQKEARVKKISSEEITLDRNLQLMRLGLELFDEDVLRSIGDKIRCELKSGFEDALGILVDMEFRSITRQYDAWITPFVRIGANRRPSNRRN